jgi:uncharacterized protein (TIGR03790 family)
MRTATVRGVRLQADRSVVRLKPDASYALVLAVALALALPVRPLEAQTGRHILLVANADSPASIDVADYYAGKRAVPADQILRLPMPVEEEIAREVYQARIENPIAAWLSQHSAQDRILYIVLTKGVPLRVAGTAGERGTVASVDSELTLLYRKLWGATSPVAGPVPNPYFAGTSGLAKAERFSHRSHDVYLVARLDGYAVDDVKALIDRGLSPAREGTVYLDARLEAGASPGNRWLTDAAAALKARPGWSDRVELDTGATVLQNKPAALGYYSWGSNDRTAGARRLNFDFLPGALAGMFVSTDARTFVEPPADWTVNGRPFRGSHQSLIGDLIRDGITGVAGQVAEPYLGHTVRPDILFPAYAAGFNLIESFYLAMPSLGWQTVVIGDPLCAPFREVSVPDADLDPPIDASTELPAFLSIRRVLALTGAGVNAEAAAWMARADARSLKGDRAGAREALERAVALDRTFVAAHMLLAAIHESAGETDQAMALYRRVLETAPNDAMALNNLAYALATVKNSPAEALPLARRAYAAMPQHAAIMDTLAWVQHLLGQDDTAEPLILNAVKIAPGSAELQLHAASILAARGKTDQAEAALNQALKIDPGMEKRPETEVLRQKLLN